MMRDGSSRLTAVVLVAITASACSDGPSGPSRADLTPASVVISGGNQQEALAGTGVLSAPIVQVTNARGDGIAGVSVRFTVTQGGGSVQTANTVTDGGGSASAGVWTLGPLPGANVLQATVDGLTPVFFTASASSPYNIAVRYIGTATTRQRAAVDSA